MRILFFAFMFFIIVALLLKKTNYFLLSIFLYLAYKFNPESNKK